MPPTTQSKRGKPIVSYPFESDKASLARARSLWGKEAFAEIQTHVKSGVWCRVGIMSGTTRVVYGSGSTWDEAFQHAVGGEQSYSSVLKSR
jgi:hypothetical protein